VPVLWIRVAPRPGREKPCRYPAQRSSANPSRWPSQDVLRVEHDDDDDLIAALIARAAGRAQTAALITQTWRLTRDVWPAGGALPILPVPLRG
jgi:hypothetical protein